MNPEVSIIVPVYNGEKYIATCIESILHQTYENFELIVINDGSIDKTDEIISKYCKVDSRIKYKVQINSGPSIARNQGIELSKGNYIMFIDADDEIISSYVEKMITCINSNTYDLVCCGYTDISKYGKFKLNDFWTGDNELDKSKFIECVCSGVGGVLWSKTFKRSIIFENNIRLNSKLFMSEDLIFVLDYCKYAENFGVINEELYSYNRLNDNSISSKIGVDYLDNYIMLIKHIKHNLKSLQIKGECINRVINLKIKTFVYMSLLREAKDFISLKNKEKSLGNIKELIENGIVQEYKSQFDNDNWISKINNYFLNKNKYSGLLYFNICLVKLRNFKDKIKGI